jgi:predicted RNase H-like HicB family nuclease
MRQVIIFPDEEGQGYTAQCPGLPGCHSQGDTWEEVIANIKEAVEVWIEDAVEYNEPIPEHISVWVG